MKPNVGQVWRHKNYGTLMSIRRDLGSGFWRLIDMENKGMAVKLHEAQLQEHYEYVEG